MLYSLRSWLHLPKPWSSQWSGSFLWEFWQFSQLGSRGFFGPYDRDNSTAAVGGVVNLAARNGWLGNEITGDNLSSGSDAATNYMYMAIRPKFTLNPAISLEGSYRIGSWANPFFDTSVGQLNYSRYANTQAYGTERSFSPGYWNTLFATVQLPWGVVNVGKMAMPFGDGFFLDGADETTTEGLTLTAPYGPLAIGLYYFPWRRGQFVNYPLLTDRNNAMQPDVGGFVLYMAGNVSAGMLCEYWNMHQGPESQLLQTIDPANLDPLNPGRSNFNPLDITVLFGDAYLNYFDGRFFFNTEGAFWQQTARNARSESGPLSPRTRYWEFWGGIMEEGLSGQLADPPNSVYCGPITRDLTARSRTNNRQTTYGTRFIPGCRSQPVPTIQPLTLIRLRVRQWFQDHPLQPRLHDGRDFLRG